MYREHATKIQAYAQRNADNLEHVGQFVAFSIHTQFDVAIDYIQEYRAKNFDSLGEVIVATRLVIYWLAENKESLHWHLQDIYNSDHSDADKADYMLAYVATEIPRTWHDKSRVLDPTNLWLVRLSRHSQPSKVQAQSLGFRALEAPKNSEGAQAQSAALQCYLQSLRRHSRVMEYLVRIPRR